MAVNVFTNGDRYITDKVLLLELSLKTKQRIPANKKSTELVNGRQSSTFFSEFESVLILPEELKKNAPATATTHNDKIRTGIFKTTSIVKTTIGYIAVNE